MIYAAKSASKKQRIYFIDELRGFLILCMVFYHALYSICFLFNFSVVKPLFFFFEPVQPLFASFFILISGAVSKLSRSNILRGLKLLLISMLVSVFTYLVMPEQIILFGILHMLSVSMISYGLLEKLLSKINTLAGLILNAIFFVITFNIRDGFIGIKGVPFLSFYIPQSFYNSNMLFPFGITTNRFFSADYFPIFPWIFVFFFGSFLGRFLLDYNLPKFFYEEKIKLFSFCGRNSLIIYLVHQPLIYIILSLVKLIF